MRRICRENAEELISMRQYFDPLLGCSWDAALLEPLAELNAGILDALASAEASLQWQWRALGEPARLRLARCPYLLADAGLTRPELWAGLRAAGVQEAVPLRAGANGSGLLATPLLRQILVFAWHLARANGLGARIALGMSPTCAAVLARCRLADLETLAEQRPAWIRPRWHDRPRLWQAWLTAAAQESPRALERLQLWGLQTMAADATAGMR
jgi:hypothetical protein